MTTLTRSASAALAFLLVSLFSTVTSPPAAAASIKTQKPCEPFGAGADGYCFKFTASDPIPIVREIAFAAPKAGTAQVTFHGSMWCGGSVNTNVDIFTRVDLASQIVAAKNAVVDLTKPGGLRHAASLGAQLPRDWSTNFNLASTRVFTIKAAGTYRYFFKIARLLQDPTITCHVYNATFTIVFI